MARLKRKKVSISQEDELDLMLQWPHLPDDVAAEMIAGMKVRSWAEKLRTERDEWIAAGRPEPFDWTRMKHEAETRPKQS